LLFKEGKHIEKIPAAGGKIETVTGSPALSKAAGEQPSPDGQRVAFWSQDADATTLNVKTVSDGKVKVLAKLLEGPRPQSAPSWSPDGKRLVFVSYQLVP
jgi:Tol biopolymer transport system component